MDKIKEAFQKVRQDIDFLKEEIFFLREDLMRIKEEIDDFNLKTKEEITRTLPTNRQIIPTNRHINQTHNSLFNPLKDEISSISTGNVGVPTDRQTDRQTDRHINQTQNIQKNKEIRDIVEILDSLDNVKKEIRLKFKRLTEKEFLVFSTIYQLGELMDVDYKILSEKLGLSESSIRDYVGKLIKKEVPLEKIKLNNKNIKLSISKDFKKIASLSTILQLRGL